MHVLAAASSAWEAGGRPEEDLFRGARLQTALEWRNAHAPELTTSESEFLDASTALHRSHLEELEERTRQDRRNNRRLRASLAAAVALFLVAALAGGLVVAGSAETERQRTEARIEALTSTSLSLRSTEPDVATLLAAEAYRRWPDDARTRSALMGVMTRSLGLLATGYPDAGREITGALIPGTREAVIVTAVPDVQVVDIDTMELVRTLDVPRNGNFMDSRLGPVVSHDGRRVAVVEQVVHTGADREGSDLAVADIATGDRVLGPVELEFLVSTIALSPDGRTVAAIDEVGTLRLIDVTEGGVRVVAGVPNHEPQPNTDRAGAVRFTPGGRLLYGTVEGRLLVVDPPSAAVLSAIPMPPEATNVSLAVLSDSQAITTGDRRIASVDLASSRVEWSQEFATEQTQPCTWVTASVELETVYCADRWGGIEERSLRTGAPTDVSFDPQLGYVGPMYVTTEGRELVVLGRGSPAITRWMLDGSGAAGRLLAPGWTAMSDYAVDGAKLVVAERVEGSRSDADYREFAVLDTASGRLTQRLPVPSRWVSWVGRDTLFGQIGGHEPEHFGFVQPDTGDHYSGVAMPDDLTWIYHDAAGTRMFASRANGEIWTIDPSTGERIEPTFQSDGFVQSVTTSPDGGEVLVTAWYTDVDEYRTTMFDGITGDELRTGLTDVVGTVLTARGEILGKEDTRMVLLDSRSFERIGTLPSVPGGGLTADVSADGRTLSAYSPSETVSIYDLAAGIRIGDPIPVSSEWTWSGMLRSDGQELAVNSRSGVVIWDLRAASHAEAACRMAGRDLTREEWATHVGELGPYRSTCGFGDD